MSKGKLLYKEFACIAWKSPGGPGDSFVSTPQFSMMTNKPARKMRAPVRLRSAPAGELAVLANDPAHTAEELSPTLYRFAANGSLLTRLGLTSPGDVDERWLIQDFVPDPDGALYLLETLQDEKSTNILRKLGPAGEPRWLHTGPMQMAPADLEALAGSYPQLLIDARSTCYLSGSRHHGLVGRIDGESGRLNVYADLGEWRGDVFMDSVGKLYFVRYVPALQGRQWISYDPLTSQEKVTTGADGLTASLALPVAVDDRGRAYTTSGMSLMRMSVTGSLNWRIRIDSVVVDQAAATLYVSRHEKDAGQVWIQRWGADGLDQELPLTLPAAMRAAKGGAYRLAYLEHGDFVIHGGETGAQLGSLLVYSSAGEFKRTMSPAPETHRQEFNLQAPGTWAVDLQGDIFLPVLGPTHLHIVKLSSSDSSD